MKITCRICITQQGEFFTLDSDVTINDEKLNLLHLVNECLVLDANLNDDLPQILCSECLVTLKLFYQFILRARKSDEVLKSQLNETIDYECNKFEDDDEQERENDCEDFYETDLASAIFNHDSQSSQSVESVTMSEAGMDENEESTSDSNVASESTAIEISRIQEPSIPQKRPTIYEPLQETRKFACVECGRKYSTELKLEQHRQLHSLKQESQCQVCEAVFNSIFEHSEHMKTHYEERKFTCEFCTKAFMSRSSLHSHLLTHYNIKPFKCEFANCGKEFRQKSILKTHMTLHTGKTIECEICNRRFSRSAHLNIHMRQHNNIRPYACSHCPNTYMQKSHLDRHVASSHMGVRYQCSTCDRAYTKKSSLNIHMRQEHSDTLPHYACEMCKKDFTKQKSLYYHLRTKHPEYNRNNKNVQ